MAILSVRLVDCIRMARHVIAFSKPGSPFVLVFSLQTVHRGQWWANRKSNLSAKSQIFKQKN